MAYPNTFRGKDEVEWLDGKSFDNRIESYHVDDTIKSKKKEDKGHVCSAWWCFVNGREIYFPKFVPFYEGTKKEYEKEYPGVFLPSNPEDLDMPDDNDKFVKTLLFLPLTTTISHKKQINSIEAGVLSIQTSFPEITDNQLAVLRMLAKYIADSIRTENEELENLNETSKAVAECNIKNLIPKNLEQKYPLEKGKQPDNIVREFPIIPLFEKTYKLLFGEDCNNGAKDLFSLSFWLKEKTIEHKGNKKLGTLSEEDEVVVNYCQERFINEKGIANIITPIKFSSLKDMNRPACFCLANNEKRLQKNEEPELLELYDWKGKATLESEWHLNVENLDKNFEQLDIKSKIDFYNNDLSKEKQDACLGSYRKYLEYVETTGFPKPTEKMPESFLFEAANDGLLVNSLLYYPIISNGKVVGVLSFQHNESYYFNDTQRQLIKTVATMLGNRIAAEAEKEKEKIEFIKKMNGIMCHSIKNDINTITGSVHLLKNLTFRSTYLSNIKLNAESVKYEKLGKKSEEFTTPIKDFFYKIDEKESFLNEKIFESLNTLDTKQYIPNIFSRLHHLKKAMMLFDGAELAKVDNIDNCKQFIDEIVDGLKINTMCVVKKDGVEGTEEHWKWGKIRVNTKSNSSKIVTRKYVLENVLENLILNSFEHAVSDKDNSDIVININFELTGSQLTITYNQEGGHKIENVENLFKLGTSTKASGGGTGMFGVRYLINEYLHGEIELSKNTDQEIELKIKYNL